MTNNELSNEFRTRADIAKEGSGWVRLHHSTLGEIANDIAQLEALADELYDQKNLWWRLACGRLRILDRVKERVMPPQEYYAWAEKFIDDETATLDAKVIGQA